MKLGINLSVYIRNLCVYTYITSSGPKHLVKNEGDSLISVLRKTPSLYGVWGALYLISQMSAGWHPASKTEFDIKPKVTKVQTPKTHENHLTPLSVPDAKVLPKWTLGLEVHGDAHLHEIQLHSQKNPPRRKKTINAEPTRGRRRFRKIPGKFLQVT